MKPRWWIVVVLLTLLVAGCSSATPTPTPTIVPKPTEIAPTLAPPTTGRIVPTAKSQERLLEFWEALDEPPLTEIPMEPDEVGLVLAEKDGKIVGGFFTGRKPMCGSLCSNPCAEESIAARLSVNDWRMLNFSNVAVRERWSLVVSNFMDIAPEELSEIPNLCPALATPTPKPGEKPVRVPTLRELQFLEEAARIFIWESTGSYAVGIDSGGMLQVGFIQGKFPSCGPVCTPKCFEESIETAMHFGGHYILLSAAQSRTQELFYKYVDTLPKEWTTIYNKCEAASAAR